MLINWMRDAYTESNQRLDNENSNIHVTYDDIKEYISICFSHYNYNNNIALGDKTILWNDNNKPCYILTIKDDTEIISIFTNTKFQEEDDQSQEKNDQSLRIYNGEELRSTLRKNFGCDMTEYGYTYLLPELEEAKAKAKAKEKAAEEKAAEEARASRAATDYEVIGGSSNVVDIFSGGKNYSVICPYCGYYGYAVGTSNLMYDAKNHHPGEITTETQGFMCGSAYQGGCRKISKYTIKVRWK